MNRRSFLQAAAVAVSAWFGWKKRPIYLHKTYKAGFMISPELLNDDLYERINVHFEDILAGKRFPL